MIPEDAITNSREGKSLSPGNEGYRDDGARSELDDQQESAGGAEVRQSLLTDDEDQAVRAHEAAVAGYDFVLDWVAFGIKRTDAPAAFHELAAIVLLATAIDRNRWIDFAHKSVFPAVYGLNLAASGQRKSTPIAYAVTAVLAACKDRYLANDYSPEALISDLAGQQPSRGVAFVDEVGRLLVTMRQKGYGEGLKDLLSRLWDAPDQYTRKIMQATFNLTSIYVNVLMATTTTRFLETVTTEDISSGFIARFLPVLVDTPVVRRPLAQRTSVTQTQEHQLAQKLAAIRAALSTPAQMPIRADAIDRLDAAEQRLEAWAEQQFHADLIRPWVRRLSEYAQRLSIIFAISETRLNVETPQVLRALLVVDRSREDARHIVEELVKGNDARDLDKIERFIRANPGISSRDLQRRTSLTVKRAHELTRELHTQGRIFVKPDGRSTHYYPA